MSRLKRVILHIGVHKTGTSALQAVFAQGREHLRMNGIAYPYPDPDNIVAIGGCSGNAIQILFEFGHARRTDQIARPLATAAYFRSLRQVIDAQDENTVLISGEYLGKLDTSQVQMLRETLSGHRIEIVAFVRDPFDYAYSCWRQVVKGSAHDRTFAEYLNEPSARFSMSDGFLAFARAFGRIHVLRYERHSKDLAKAFFDAIERPDAMPETGPGNRIHNRSLSPSEASLCVALAKGLKSRNFVLTAAQHMLARTDRRELPFYSRRLHATVIDRFRDAAAEINRRLPAEDHLSLSLRDSDQGAQDILPEDAAFVLDLLHRNVMAKLSAYVGAEGKPTVDGLPADFDAAAYLLLNPDVAEARFDPVEHYRRHGQFEQRRYSFF